MGSGFRTFTAGEVLTASNVQNYLQDQVVMTFAGSAARSSAIGTANFEEGMVSYLTDTDKVEAYNGTNWVQVGSSNQGLTLINTTSFSGVSSQAVTSVFSATYLRYLVLIQITSASNNDRSIFLKLRNGATDTSTNYNSFIAAGTRAGVTSNLAQSDDTNGYKLGEIDGPETGNNFAAAVQLVGPFVNDRSQMHIQTSFVDTGGNFRYGAGGGNRTAGGSHDGLNLIASAGTITGTIRVYGYSN